MYKACGNSMYNLGFACAQFASLPTTPPETDPPVGKHRIYTQASLGLSAQLIRTFRTLSTLLTRNLSLLSTHLTTTPTTYINTYLRKA